MRYLLMILVLLTFCGLNVSAQKNNNKLVWETGKIVQQQYEANTKTVPYTSTDISKDVTDSQREEKKEILMRDDYEEVRVQTANGVYLINRHPKLFWNKILNLKDGDTVQIAIKDGYVYLKNSKGKQAKYNLLMQLPNEPEKKDN